MWSGAGGVGSMRRFNHNCPGNPLWDVLMGWNVCPWDCIDCTNQANKNNAVMSRDLCMTKWAVAFK